MWICTSIPRSDVTASSTANFDVSGIASASMHLLIAYPFFQNVQLSKPKPLYFHPRCDVTASSTANFDVSGIASASMHLLIAYPFFQNVQLSKPKPLLVMALRPMEQLVFTAKLTDVQRMKYRLHLKLYKEHQIEKENEKAVALMNEKNLQKSNPCYSKPCGQENCFNDLCRALYINQNHPIIKKSLEEYRSKYKSKSSN